MMNSKICIAQELLLKWMACGEKKRSYESIRRNCEYLDQAYELGLGNNAIWALFHPLFRTGVIEFTGKDCYALSPTIAIESDGHFIYNSPLPQKKTNSTKFTGIYRTEDPDDIEGIKIVHFNAEKILKHMKIYHKPSTIITKEQKALPKELTKEPLGIFASLK